MMEISALQKERSAYQPKLPKALQGAVKIVEGAPTQSVDNQEEIKNLFPNTYGMPLVELDKLLGGTMSLVVCSMPLRNLIPKTAFMAF